MCLPTSASGHLFLRASCPLELGVRSHGWLASSQVWLLQWQPAETVANSLSVWLANPARREKNTKLMGSKSGRKLPSLSPPASVPHEERYFNGFDDGRRKTFQERCVEEIWFTLIRFNQLSFFSDFQPMGFIYAYLWSVTFTVESRCELTCF